MSAPHKSKRNIGSQHEENARTKEQKEIPENELRKILDVDEGK